MCRDIQYTFRYINIIAYFRLLKLKNPMIFPFVFFLFVSLLMQYNIYFFSYSNKHFETLFVVFLMLLLLLLLFIV